MMIAIYIARLRKKEKNRNRGKAGEGGGGVSESDRARRRNRRPRRSDSDAIQAVTNLEPQHQRKTLNPGPHPGEQRTRGEQTEGTRHMQNVTAIGPCRTWEKKKPQKGTSGLFPNWGKCKIPAKKKKKKKPYSPPVVTTSTISRQQGRKLDRCKVSSIRSKQASLQCTSVAASMSRPEYSTPTPAIRYIVPFNAPSLF